MKVIALSGSSGSGKTRLIESLAAEFKKRSFRLAVVKHCPHGFDMTDEGKDSRKYLRAGAVAAALVGPRGRMAIRPGQRSPDLLGEAARFFPDADVVLVEGGSRTPGLKKIEVLRQGIPAKSVGPAADVVAYVSEKRLKVGKPVFRPRDTAGIADMIENKAGVIGPEARLSVDGRDVPLNGFAQQSLTKAVRGMVASLRRTGANPRRIILSLRRNEHGTQKD
jgi:molybdopterin-guanine dinucleotide biosynthesis protein B